MKSILNNQADSQYLKHFENTTHDSILYIDSDERTSGPTNNATYRSSEIMREEVSRIAVNKVHVRYNIPTININNSIVTFLSVASGLTHSVSLAEGYYDPTTLMTELQTKLNSVSGASLMTFNIVPLTAGANAYVITGTAFFQILPSTQVDRGAPCTGLFPMATSSLSITVVAKAFYTSYLDFCIGGLKDGQTRPNTFSHYTKFPNSQHLFRQHVNVDRGIYDDVIIDKEIHNLHYNKVRRRKLSEITIEVYDEFGELFYEFDDVSFVSYALEISLLS